jgi:hypothetical protein
MGTPAGPKFTTLDEAVCVGADPSLQAVELSFELAALAMLVPFAATPATWLSEDEVWHVAVVAMLESADAALTFSPRICLEVRPTVWKWVLAQFEPALVSAASTVRQIAWLVLEQIPLRIACWTEFNGPVFDSPWLAFTPSSSVPNSAAIVVWAS